MTDTPDHKPNTPEELPPDQEFAEAKDVSEFLLDVTGKAYFNGDEDAFVSRFILPQEFGTFDGNRIIRTREELATLFHGMRANFQSRGVTDLVRVCISAYFDGPDTVHATHVSYLMSGRKLLSEPFPSNGVLRRVSGRWMISNAQYAPQDQWYSDALLKFDGAPPADGGSMAPQDTGGNTPPLPSSPNVKLDEDKI